jgi:Tol biopolymer transport system component
MDWSRDGTQLAGYVAGESGRPAGIAVYDLAAKKARLVASDETWCAKWLDDNRRLIYFTRNGTELVVLDTATGARTRVDVQLPARASDDVFALGPKGRTIYYGAVRAEADIWIVERGQAGAR